MALTLQTIDKEVKQIKKYLNKVNSRLDRIENQLGIEYQTEEVAETPAIKKQEVVAKKSDKESGFEAKVGLKWLGRIGILSLVLGIGFFIKYAFDNNWVGMLGRVIIGVTIGLLLIVVGELFNRKEQYFRLAHTVTGGGFAIIYFAVFAAYHFKNYREAIGITLEVDLALLTIVVILAVIFSLRYNSPIIAGAAFFLGYLTAFLSIDIGIVTLLYCLILTIGIVVVASVRKWGYMSIAGLFATYIVFMIWFYDASRSLLPTISFLLAYFMIFTVNSLSFKSQKDNDVDIYGVFIAIANSFFFYVFAYLWLSDHFPSYKGLFTLAMAIVYLILTYLSSSLQLKKLLTTHLVLIVLYLTLTIPIQLNNDYVTIAWAVEGLLLLYLAFKLPSVPLRYLGYSVGVIVISKTLFIDSWFLKSFSFDNIIGSTRFFSYLVAIVTIYLSIILLEIHNKQLKSWEENVSKIYYFSFVLLITVIIALELNELWISVAWGIEALIILIIGFALKTKERRLVGIGLLGLVIFKVFFMDLRDLDTLFRIISFMGLGIILLVASFLYAKYKDILLMDD